MKILYLTDTLTVYGGLERVMVDKMNYLVDNYGYEICVVTTSQGLHSIPYRLSPKVSMRDIDIQFHHEYRHSGIVRLFASYQMEKVLKRRLYVCLRELNPNIIICTRTEFVKTIVKVKGKIPMVFESHSMFDGFRYEGHSFLHRIRLLNYRRSLRYADYIVSLTEGDANDWRHINKNVRVIPNVVHLNKTGCYSNCENKKAIFVGRFTKQKDIESLIKIWKIVNKHYPKWILEVYGAGELGCLFDSKAKNINIIVNSPTPDIFEKYRDCSMLLLTSIYEPFGLVLPEAMSCGLPVISFDCPYGPADIVTDGLNGFLVRNRDIDLFSQRVCQLIESVELRKRMGTAAVQSVNKYSADRIMPLWKSFFENIILAS